MSIDPWKMYYSMYCRCNPWVLDPPLRSSAALFGWMMIALSILVPLLPPGYVNPTTREFATQDVIPIWLFTALGVVAGYAVAMPGERWRKQRNFLGAVSCFFWLGTCLWPLFSGSDNPITILGTVMWVIIALQLLLFADSNPRFIENVPHEHRGYNSHLGEKDR